MSCRSAYNPPPTPVHIEVMLCVCVDAACPPLCTPHDSPFVPSKANVLLKHQSSRAAGSLVASEETR